MSVDGISRTSPQGNYNQGLTREEVDGIVWILGQVVIIQSYRGEHMTLDFVIHRKAMSEYIPLLKNLS